MPNAVLMRCRDTYAWPGVLYVEDAQPHARPSTTAAADTSESYDDSATLVVKSEPLSAGPSARHTPHRH